MLLFLLVMVLGVVLMWRYGEWAPGVMIVEEGAPAPEIIADSPDSPDDGLSDVPSGGAPVRFLMYNVQNYFVPGEESRSRFVCRAKPVKSREAVADVIAEVGPDILGLIEIGGKLALEDLRKRLSERGMEYPHAYVLERQGEDRALALLSKYPIVSNDSVTNQNLYGQKRRKMLRGILDITIGLEDGRRFRIVGAHLKSRMGSDAAAARHLRAQEARTLAFHLYEQISRSSSLPVLVYGDWNDGPGDESLGVLVRGVGKGSNLYRVPALDSRGHGWTIYYEETQEYSVFDQIFLNRALHKRCGRKIKCGIADIPAAQKASDHRAVWCELR